MNEEIKFKQLETKAALEVMDNFRKQIASRISSAEQWNKSILEEQKKDRPDKKKIEKWSQDQIFHLMIAQKMEDSLEKLSWDIESQLFDF